MNKIKSIFAILILILTINCFAEELETIKDPVKAGALSFVIPGGGQYYNGKYLKTAIVLGIDTYLVSMSLYHEEKRTDYRRKAKLAENEAEINYYNNLADDNYKRRQSDYWWMGTSVFLSMMDAYVDAHLYNFDIKKKEIELRFDDAKLTLSYKF